MGGSYLEMLWSRIIVTTLVSNDVTLRNTVTKVVLFKPPYELEAISLIQQTLRHNLLLTG
jgi:hypothetical protein